MNRRCEECNASLEGKRSDASYCTRRCKVRASDRRRREDGRSRRRDRARYAREAKHRRAYARDKAREYRDLAVSHYGETCEGCGVTEDLELDHVNANGEDHRDAVGHGTAFYRWLVNENFPTECEPGGEYELQILCSSCHLDKTRRERSLVTERG